MKVLNVMRASDRVVIFCTVRSEIENFSDLNFKINRINSYFILQRSQVFWLTNKIKAQMDVVSLSSELTMPERDAAMRAFMDNQARVLVCTNLCCRGLELNVNLVINYDTPRKQGNQFDPKVYTYRVSRCGRFGQRGIAITLNSKCASKLDNVLLRDYNVQMITLWTWHTFPISL